MLHARKTLSWCDLSPHAHERGKSGWSGTSPGSRFEVFQALSLGKKPHPPINAVGEGKILLIKDGETSCQSLAWTGASLSGNAALFFFSHGPLCGCERSGATREASAVNLTGLVRSVMQMKTRGQFRAKTSGLKQRIRAHYHGSSQVILGDDIFRTKRSRSVWRECTTCMGSSWKLSRKSVTSDRPPAGSVRNRIDKTTSQTWCGWV